MPFPQVLSQEWLGNTPRNWAVAVGVFLGIFVALLLLRRLFVSRLGAIAKRTTSDVDDVLVDIVAKTRPYFMFMLALAAALRWLDMPRAVELNVGRLLAFVVLLQAGVWGNTAIGSWVKRHLDRRRALADTGSVTTITAISYAARAMVWAVVFVLVLDNLGFKITTLVTGLGIGGIAIALAVQNILGDLFGALAIVLDKPFVVGDAISVNGQLDGTVEHIGLKTTRIRSLSGEQIIISNTELLKGNIRNYKRLYERRVVFRVDVTYDTPPDVVAGIPAMIRAIVTSHSPVRFDRSHFAAYTDSALRIETVYFVLDPDYTKYMDIQQSINLQILRRFGAEKIGFAFPTRTVELHGPALQPDDARIAATSTSMPVSTLHPPRSTVP